MSEHLNDEELALELTKLFVEHMNHNVDIKRPKTMMNADSIAATYQTMLSAVFNPTSYLKPHEDDQ